MAISPTSRFEKKKHKKILKEFQNLRKSIAMGRFAARSEVATTETVGLFVPPDDWEMTLDRCIRVAAYLRTYRVMSLVYMESGKSEIEKKSKATRDRERLGQTIDCFAQRSH